MSRYMRATNVGVGNYGGLAHAWGFGGRDDDDRTPHRYRRRRRYSIFRGPSAETIKKAKKATAKYSKDLAKQKEWEKRKRIKEADKESREARQEAAKERRQEEREERRRQEERRQEEKREELREGIEDIKGRRASREIIQQVQQDILRTQFPGAVVPGAPLPLVVRAPMVRRPMMMQMPRAAPRPVFKPRGPVKAPIITPQQARLGTLAAALASAMLLF